MRWSSNFEIVDVREIASGGFGKVFRAKLVGRAGIRHEVVLKMPWGRDARAFREAEETMLEESRIMARIAHPNIVRSHGYLSVAVDCAEARRFNACQHGRPHVAGHELPVLVLEDAGISLEKVLQAFGGRMDAARAIYIATQLLRGLGHLHEQNIVHRDIKPNNILIGANGEVKLGDLGIAKDKLSPKETTKLGVAKGTIFYMAPESILVPKNGDARVKVDRRADIYAVGVLLYKLVSGRYPWHYGGNIHDISFYVEWSHKVENEPIDALPEELVTKEVFEIIKKCLSKDRDSRFEDAPQVIEALQPFCPPPHACAAQLAYTARRTIENAENDSKAGAVTVPVNGDKPAPSASAPAGPELVSLNIIVPPEMQDDSYNSLEFQPEPPPEVDAEMTARVLAGNRPRGRVGGRKAGVVVASAFAAVALLASAGLLSKQEAIAEPRSSLQRPPAEMPAKLPPSSPSPRAAEPSTELAAVVTPRAAQIPGGPATDSPMIPPTPIEETSVVTPPATEGSLDQVTEEQPARASVGRLEVVVLPRGAYLSLDGEGPVQAPYTFSRVKVGSHVVKLGLASDALDRTEKVKIKPGVNRLRVELANPFGG